MVAEFTREIQLVSVHKLVMRGGSLRLGPLISNQVSLLARKTKQVQLPCQFLTRQTPGMMQDASVASARIESLKWIPMLPKKEPAV